MNSASAFFSFTALLVLHGRGFPQAALAVGLRLQQSRFAALDPRWKALISITYEHRSRKFLIKKWLSWRNTCATGLGITHAKKPLEKPALVREPVDLLKLIGVSFMNQGNVREPA